MFTCSRVPKNADFDLRPLYLMSQTDSEGHGYLELARTWLEAASKMDYGPEILALPSCRWR
jgi:hypothetical protein